MFGCMFIYTLLVYMTNTSSGFDNNITILSKSTLNEAHKTKVNRFYREKRKFYIKNQTPRYLSKYYSLDPQFALRYVSIL